MEPTLFLNGFRSGIARLCLVDASKSGKEVRTQFLMTSTTAACWPMR